MYGGSSPNLGLFDSLGVVLCWVRVTAATRPGLGAGRVGRLLSPRVFLEVRCSEPRLTD
jgi:hypothetical protein